MIGIDLQIPGFGSNNSTNCATTNCPFFISRCKIIRPRGIQSSDLEKPVVEFRKNFQLANDKNDFKADFSSKIYCDHFTKQQIKSKIQFSVQLKSQI